MMDACICTHVHIYRRLELEVLGPETPKAKPYTVVSGGSEVEVF